jgi:uncharacterized protein (TIGR03437 family)
MMPIRILFLLLSCAALWAQSTPPEVYLNHAGHRRSALAPGQALAPGSLADISVFLNNPPSIPTIEKIQFKAPGATDYVELSLLPSLRSAQATVRIPLDSPTGQAEILIQLSGGTEKRLSFSIQDTNFGWFTRSNDPSGAAIAQTAGHEVRLTQPARSGDVLTLWGTGLGRAKLESVQIEIGGKLITPTYVGPAPGHPGLDQINVAVAEEVDTDCYIPLRLRIGESASPPASLPTAAPSDQPTSPPCRHRLGLLPDQLATLDKDESIRMGQTWAYGTVMPDFEKPGLYRRYDAASIDFLDRSADYIQTLTGLFEPPLNGCRLETSAVSGAAIFASPADFGLTELLGPNGFRQEMEGMAWKNYTFPNSGPFALQAIPGFAMAAGAWRIRVAGGAQFKALETPLHLPPALRWINRTAALSHPLNDDFTLRWAAEGYNEGERMTATLQLQAPAIGPAILCESPASAASIVIPAALLQRMTTVPAAISISLRLGPNPARPTLSSASASDGKAIPLISRFTYSELINGTLH